MEYDAFARLSVSFPANSSFLTAWPKAWSDGPAFASGVGEQPVVLGSRAIVVAFFLASAMEVITRRVPPVKAG